MPDVHKLNILTASRWSRPGEAERYCFDAGVAAMGWPVEGERPTSFDDYWPRAVKKYGSRAPAAVRRFHDLPHGTLLWTRDRKGDYRLGQLRGKWFYSDEQTALDLDIVNQRDTEWLDESFTALQVPGDLVRAWSAPRQSALSRMASDPMAEFSHATWAGTTVGKTDALEVVKRWLGWWDIEDLVSLYLQRRHGLLVLAPDRARTHPAYDLEFFGEGRHGVVQVKTGDAGLDFDALSNLGEAWGYADRGRTTGTGHRIEPEDLASFLAEERGVLPERFTRWLA